MKVKTSVLSLLFVLFASFFLKAADAGKTAAWIDGLTVAPVVAQRSAGFTGASDLGAGLDIGFNLNKFVSLHVGNLTFENHDWRSAAVDETEIYAKANLARFAKESFLVYGKGGVARDWNDDKWSLAVGLGAQLNLNKTVALVADYTIRSKFGGSESGLARAGMQFTL